MSEEAKRKFSELNMTRDELDRFTEAMKKEEFRKLLVEYAEELSDPKNREQYEKEIAQLEEERGMNVTFIHPEKGFCLKTTQNGELKCFINICKNENIEKPRCQNETQNTNGQLS
jgi:dynein assembly factor 2